LSGTATSELSRRRSWRPGGAAYAVISTWRENAVMVWSRTGRSSLRGYGLDESGNGAWLRWIFGSAASVIQQSYGEQRRRRKGEMERRLGEQARGGFKARLRRQGAHGAWPARSGERRRVADTRLQVSEPVGHGDSDGYLKTRFSC